MNVPSMFVCVNLILILMLRTSLYGKMRHLWNDNQLHLKLRLRLYKSSVCSILAYGSEAWILYKGTRRSINGVNTSMVSVITDHREDSPRRNGENSNRGSDINRKKCLI